MKSNVKAYQSGFNQTIVKSFYSVKIISKVLPFYFKPVSVDFFLLSMGRIFPCQCIGECEILKLIFEKWNSEKFLIYYSPHCQKELDFSWTTLVTRLFSSQVSFFIQIVEYIIFKNVGGCLFFTAYQLFCKLFEFNEIVSCDLQTVYEFAFEVNCFHDNKNFTILGKN